MRGSTGNRASCSPSAVSSRCGAERAELLEHAVALVDRARVRRVEEGEVLDVAEAERLHPEDDAGEARPLDLGIGERRPRGEARLLVEAEADAVADAAAAPLALVGARLRDGLDLQARRTRARIVAVEAREARVDHVDDARDGERRLGDVGGEDDAPLRDAWRRPAPGRRRERRA